YVVHWGDSSSDTYTSNGVKTHTYVDGPSDHGITVDLVDEDGTFTDAANPHLVHVDNVPPTVHLSGAGATDEGTTETYSYTFTDPGSADTWTHATSCGAHGSRSADSFDQSTKAGSFKCTWPDNYTGEAA